MNFPPLIQNGNEMKKTMEVWKRDEDGSGSGGDGGGGGGAAADDEAAAAGGKIEHSRKARWLQVRKECL